MSELFIVAVGVLSMGAGRLERPKVLPLLHLLPTGTGGSAV